jgi:hypothetical protein
MRCALTNWLVVIALLVAPLSACGSSGQPGEPANPVDGTIVAIVGNELTLETVEGERHVFTIADPNVSVEHLHEHRIQRLPVRIS